MDPYELKNRALTRINALVADHTAALVQRNAPHEEMCQMQGVIRGLYLASDAITEAHRELGAMNT